MDAEYIDNKCYYFVTLETLYKQENFRRWVWGEYSMSEIEDALKEFKLASILESDD